MQRCASLRWLSKKKHKIEIHYHPPYCPEMNPTELLNQDLITSDGFTEVLVDAEIKICMDGNGRALDNVFVERLWRSVKYEEVYIKNYRNVSDAYCNLNTYFQEYNTQRLHQALGYKAPSEVYRA